MKGDFSRFSFDKKKRYSAVLMQQGRLQLDSDWNEQVQISEHRNTAFFRDLVGRSGTPAGNAMTLLLEKETGKLTLTRGVCYIDGLFVENDAPVELTKEALPEGGGEFLFYLDAWTREVNAAEDSELVDPALGLETTTRLKTEWKLRHKEIPKAGADKWKEAFEGGRWPEASARELPPGLGEDNWWLSVSTGKMVLGDREVKVKDNRLYRIEIHDNNPAVRFKWSRDNAAVCAEVKASLEHAQAYALSNNSVPLQEAFKDAAWIELCTPKEAGLLLDMRHLAFENGILKLSPEHFDAFKDKEQLIIRRWDGVFCKEEKENSLKAELGVELAYSEGFYRSGDYWLLLIRDGEALNWKEGGPRPPEGVVHHFAALASVNISKEGRIEEPKSWHLHFNPLTSPNLTAESDLNVGNLTVRLNADMQGNASVGGALKVNGNTTIAGTLSAPTLTGNTSIAGALTVSGTGNSSIAGPLALSGNTTVGTSAANRTLTVNGATSVSGALTAGSTANIAGNTTVGGTLAANSTASIAGNTTVGGALTVNGTGNSSIAGPLTLSGNTTIGSANANRTLTVNGAATVSGEFTANSTATIHGALTAEDRVSAKDFRCASLEANVYNELRFNGLGLGMTGNPNEYTLHMEHDHNAKVGNITFRDRSGSGTPTTTIFLSGKGNGTFSGSLTVGGGLTVNGTGSSRIAGPLTVVGALTAGTMAGNINFTGPWLTIVPTSLTKRPPNWGSGLHVWDIYSEATIGVGKNGNVVSSINSSGDAHFGRNLHVVGNITIGGKLGTSNYPATPATSGWGGGIRTWDLEAHGCVKSGAAYARFSDLAENFESTTPLEPGDVVCLAQDKGHICLSDKSNHPFLLGIISTAPGFVLNGHDEEFKPQENHYPVALSGRVPCKVTDEGGPIRRGDLLTSSSSPGRAMKAHPNAQGYYAPGTLIGKALEPLNEKEGCIEVFVFLR